MFAKEIEIEREGERDKYAVSVRASDKHSLLNVIPIIPSPLSTPNDRKESKQHQLKEKPDQKISRSTIANVREREGDRKNNFSQLCAIHTLCE